MASRLVSPHCGVNVEVAGTHSGLMFNREVYRHLAGILAGEHSG